MTSAPDGHPRSPGAGRWPRLRVWLLGAGIGLLVLSYLLGYPLSEPLAPLRIDRPTPERSAAARPPRVAVLISVDGLAPWVLDGTQTPVLERLAREGVRAADARTVVPPHTLPSHASMLSSVPPEIHGLHWNRYQPWSRFDQSTLFTLCAERGLRCGLFAGKRKMAHFAEREAGVERYVYAAGASEVLDRALEYLGQRDADFVMIHLAEVDRSGHRSGWGSEAQRASLRAVDAAIGGFLERVAARIDRPVVVIVTADHGGIGTGHCDPRRENVHIPWIAWGDGVRAGADPGPVSTLDTAPTLLALLGLPAPAGWLGRPRAAILDERVLGAARSPLTATEAFVREQAILEKE